MSDTYVWQIEISQAGETIGSIHTNTIYYTGPCTPSENCDILDLTIENIGTIAGNINYKIYEFPGEPEENLLTSGSHLIEGGQYLHIGEFIFITPQIPGMGFWPLGLKVWGESEEEPLW